MTKLNSDQRINLEMLVKKTRDVNERNRICVILGRDDGHSPIEIAAILRISASSVYDYLREYDAKQKTINDSHPGRTSKLTTDQESQLKTHLAKTTYLTVKEICRYVEAQYGVKYTVAGMTFWLNRQGFVYKKPMKIPGKLDPDKQAAFIEKYNDLKGQLKEGEKIFFLDAVHPEYQSQAVSGWILKNETKTIGTTAKQTRMHFVGAVELTEMKIVTKEYLTIDASSIIDFLKELENSTLATKIHVICDNGRSNKNKDLQKYLEGQSRIQFHYLPPYSPNLNPIERLWKVMRERVTYNKLYEKFSDFSEKIRGFFSKKILELEEVLRARINDNFQKIIINPLQTSI
jgi:transposase